MAEYGENYTRRASCLVINFGVQNYDGLMIGLAVPLITIIISGNALTLVVIWCTKDLQTTTNTFLGSLAASDLLVAIAVIGNIIEAISNFTKHVMSTTVCLATAITFQMSTALSVFSLLLISIDRCIYICFPMKYNRLVTTKRTRFIIIISWMAIMLGCIIEKCEMMDNCSNCQTMPLLIASLVLFGLVYLIMLSCYGAILRAAVRQRRRIRAVSASAIKWTTSDMKLVKLMFSVMGIFSSLWIPISVLSAVDAISGSKFISDYGSIAHFLAVANSGLNFFIYIAKNNEFRNAIRKLLTIRRK